MKIHQRISKVLHYNRDYLCKFYLLACLFYSIFASDFRVNVPPSLCVLIFLKCLLQILQAPHLDSGMLNWFSLEATSINEVISLCLFHSYEGLEKKLKEVFTERTGILRQLSKTSKELDSIKGNLQVSILFLSLTGFAVQISWREY